MIRYSKYQLCSDPVCNVEVDGHVVGFRVWLLHPAYKGVRLSYLQDVMVVVDGKQYHLNDGTLQFTIGSGTYKIEDLPTCGWHRWNFCEKAELFIPLEGGLKPGKHRIEALSLCRDMHGGGAAYQGGWREIEMGEKEEITC